MEWLGKTKIRFLFGLIIIISFVLNFFLVYQFLNRRKVEKVIDGDSLDLRGGMRIRLLGVDAPEQGRCMSYHAQERLEQLVLNKRVALKDKIKDNYGRILANVFIGNIFVNKVLAEEGLARFEYIKSPYYDEMKLAQKQAKSGKLGIYSPLCRITTIQDVDCPIKGNSRAGKKVYHLPGCPNYTEVIVDESYGDHWFCSENEAQAAGFRKAGGCK